MLAQSAKIYISQGVNEWVCNVKVIMCTTITQTSGAVLIIGYANKIFCSDWLSPVHVHSTKEWDQTSSLVEPVWFHATTKTQPWTPCIVRFNIYKFVVEISQKGGGET